jgi:hypothetical protein
MLSASLEADPMVTVDHFRRELMAQIGRATIHGFLDILVNSGDLHRSCGGYPGSAIGMPACCDAKQNEMQHGDILLLDRTNGAGMTVRYVLPRVS